MDNFSKKEILTGLMISLVIVFVFNLPWITAKFNTPQGMSFSGQNSVFDPWDINVYVSAIKWSQEFPFKYRNMYSTTSSPSPVVYPLYTLTGTLFPNIDAFMLFNMLQLSAGFLLIFTTYLICVLLLKTTRQVVIATILIFFAGGFGWLVRSEPPLPDVSITPFTFIGTLNKPHESIAVVFYFLSLFFIYKGLKNNRVSQVVYSAVLFLPVIIFYPYYSLSYLLIVVSFSVYLYRSSEINLKQILKMYLNIGIITIPVLMIHSAYLLGAPGLSNVFSPYLYTPAPIRLMLGYGILTPVLIYQLFSRTKNKLLVFLNIWFFVSILLSYTPLSFSRYYLRGLFFPAVIITLLSVDNLSEKLNVPAAKINYFIYTLIPLTTAATIMAMTFWVFNENNPWVYISKQRQEVINYLNNNSGFGDGIIVDDFIFANQIPAHTLNRVYLGHEYQTPNAKSKIEDQTSFFSAELTKNEAESFLEDNNIKHIISSGEASDQIKEYSFLKLQTKEGAYEVYSVN